MKLKNQTGQSLLEIVVVLAVLGLVLGGMVTVILNGLKNSQFSKNQAQATKLAQEALDMVRIMKNNENCDVVSDGNTYYWTNQTPLVWGSSAADNKTYAVTLQPNCRLQQSAAVPVAGNFSRSIQLSPDTATRLKVTAIVTWSDASGSHQSDLVTILAQ